MDREPYVFFNPELAGSIMTCVKTSKDGKCLKFEPTPGAECIVESPAHPKKARKPSPKKLTPPPKIPKALMPYAQAAAKFSKFGDGERVTRAMQAESRKRRPGLPYALIDSLAEQGYGGGDPLEYMKVARGFWTAARRELKPEPPPKKPAAKAKPVTAGKKQPWEMTRDEWHNAKDAAKPRYEVQKATRASAAEAVRGIRELERLNYDAAMWNDVAEGFTTDHIDVVAKAFREGKPIPPSVTANYPAISMYVKGKEYKAKLKRSKEIRVEFAKQKEEKKAGVAAKKASRGKPTPQWLAEEINKHAEEYESFYASQLVKETINLWRIPKNYALLSDYSRVFADHYLSEEGGLSGASCPEGLGGAIMTCADWQLVGKAPNQFIRCKTFKATCPSPGLKVIPKAKKPPTPVKPLKAKPEKPTFPKIRQMWQLTRDEFSWLMRGPGKPVTYAVGEFVEGRSDPVYTTKQPRRGVVLEQKREGGFKVPTEYLVRWEDGSENWNTLQMVFALGHWKAREAASAYHWKGDPHLLILRKAIAEGKKVPAAVRAQYPELAVKVKKPPKGRRAEDFKAFWGYAGPKKRIPEIIFTEFPQAYSVEVKRRKGRLFKVFAYDPQDASQRIIEAMGGPASAMSAYLDSDGVRFIYPKKDDPTGTPEKGKLKTNPKQPWQMGWSEYSTVAPAFGYDPDMFLKMYRDTEKKSGGAMMCFMRDIFHNTVYMPDKVRRGKWLRARAFKERDKAKWDWYSALQQDEDRLKDMIEKGMVKVVEQPVSDFNQFTGKNIWIHSPAIPKPTTELHERSISSALRAGLDVPAAVVKEYPHLSRLAKEAKVTTKSALVKAYHAGIEQAMSVDPSEQPADMLLVLYGLASALRSAGVKASVDDLLGTWYHPAMRAGRRIIASLEDPLDQVIANMEEYLNAASSADSVTSVAQEVQVVRLFEDARDWGKLGRPGWIRGQVQTAFYNLANRVPIKVAEHVKRDYNVRKGTKRWKQLMDENYDAILSQEIPHEFHDAKIALRDLTREIKESYVARSFEHDVGGKSKMLRTAGEHLKALQPNSPVAQQALGLANRIDEKVKQNMRWLRGQAKRLETELAFAEKSAKAVAGAVRQYNDKKKELERTFDKLKGEADADYQKELEKEFGTAVSWELPKSDDPKMQQVTERFKKKWEKRVVNAHQQKERHTDRRPEIIKQIANKRQPGAGKAFYVQGQLRGLGGLDDVLLSSMLRAVVGAVIRS